MIVPRHYEDLKIVHENTMPYRAYYMSANLDHVLYDKLNSSDKDKENDAFLRLFG